jgi:hypothetical protein
LAQLLKPNNVKVVTKDGEMHVTISLELTINLNSDNLKVTASPSYVVPQAEQKAKKQVDDNPMWEIPDFAPMPKVEFGKKA